MKVTIIGGSEEKKSGVVEKIYNEIKFMHSDFDYGYYNGGFKFDFFTKNPSGDLIIWMPDISNEVEKHYPRKPMGSTLICSKVMRDGYTPFDAVSRIFKMNANAVIAIYRTEHKFSFSLIDALGNVWVNPTTDLVTLIMGIMKFYQWSSNQIRVQTSYAGTEIKINSDSINEFLKINRKLSDTTKKIGTRYFGNCSTRCMNLFPSSRIFEDSMLVSKRNSNKESITSEDMVLVDKYLSYYSKDKPSVDTPVQQWIYRNYPSVNYIIHGHAYIKGLPFVEDYYPCGDMRETRSMIWGEEIPKGINMRHHGFLIMAYNLPHLKTIVNTAEIDIRVPGQEIIQK